MRLFRTIISRLPINDLYLLMYIFCATLFEIGKRKNTRRMGIINEGTFNYCFIYGCLYVCVWVDTKEQILACAFKDISKIFCPI